MTIVEQLLLHEALRLKPYRDTTGHLTIGVGRNLDAVGISRAEAMLLLSNDIERAYKHLTHALPWVKQLSPIRQRVLVDMCFNLGIKGLLKFQHTLTAIEEGRFMDATVHMLRSQWAEQVGKKKGQRAWRLATMMKEDREVA